MIETSVRGLEEHINHTNGRRMSVTVRTVYTGGTQTPEACMNTLMNLLVFIFGMNS